MTETNGANFLIVESGTIVSPTTRNTLPGVSRQVVIELAGKLRIPFLERDVSLSAAMGANEAFLSSTPYCLLPVCAINGVVIGDGKPGRVFQRLLDSWSKMVGVDIRQQIVGQAFQPD